jgi:bacterial/archaeal transporter family-2 protein
MAVTAGLAGSVQAAVMGRLGQRIGTMEALGFSTVVAGATGVVVLLVARRSLHAFPAALDQPAWLWIGGVLSAFIVLSMTVAAPRIGVAAAIGLVIAGQLFMAAAIDRFGWLGVEKIPLHWYRILGIALLASGAALSLKK